MPAATAAYIARHADVYNKCVAPCLRRCERCQASLTSSPRPLPHLLPSQPEPDNLPLALPQEPPLVDRLRLASSRPCTWARSPSASLASSLASGARALSSPSTLAFLAYPCVDSHASSSPSLYLHVSRALLRHRSASSDGESFEASWPSQTRRGEGGSSACARPFDGWTVRSSSSRRGLHRCWVELHERHGQEACAPPRSARGRCRAWRSHRADRGGTSGARALVSDVRKSVQQRQLPSSRSKA